MTNLQKIKDKNRESHLSRAVRDLVLLIVITIFTLILSYFFNLFSLIVEFLQKHPDKIIYVDEVITTLLILSIGLAVFAWRRWLELRKETAERIKKQEELIRITATQADTERIISKQLHIDMDQMKQDVQEILHFLLKKHKKTV